MTQWPIPAKNQDNRKGSGGGGGGCSNQEGGGGGLHKFENRRVGNIWKGFIHSIKLLHYLWFHQCNINHRNNILCRYIIGKGVLTPLLYEDPLHCLPTFQFLFNPPPPSFLLPPNPTPNALSVVLFFWQNGSSDQIWCAILLNDISIMDLIMPSLGTFIEEGPLRVFYATRCQVYWGLPHNVVFCSYSDLISCTHKDTCINTQRHTEQSEASRLKHLYKYIFISTVMCSQQLSLLHSMNNSLTQNIYFSVVLLFKNYSLVKVIHLLIRML